MEDQDDHGDNQKYVYKPAANIGEQAQKPENCNDDGYPKQHKNLLRAFTDGNADSSPHGPRVSGGDYHHISGTGVLEGPNNKQYA
jgi:hypothetical protein